MTKSEEKSHGPSVSLVFTIAEAAEFLRMPVNTCRALVYSGRLRSVRMSSRMRRITRADLLAFVGMTIADLTDEERGCKLPQPALTRPK